MSQQRGAVHTVPRLSYDLASLAPRASVAHLDKQINDQLFKESRRACLDTIKKLLGQTLLKLFRGCVEYFLRRLSRLQVRAGRAGTRTQG